MRLLVIALVLIVAGPGSAAAAIVKGGDLDCGTGSTVLAGVRMGGAGWSTFGLVEAGAAAPSAVAVLGGTSAISPIVLVCHGLSEWYYDNVGEAPALSVSHSVEWTDQFLLGLAGLICGGLFAWVMVRAAAP
jgi:hypothetical protein